ncbi:MAG: tyrosine-type recombinase/integrase, partial [Byssovorax sp.]
MIRKTDRRGQRILVIDIRYKKPDGCKGRYRHDAQVQTMAAATAEERRLLANIAQYGDVHEPKLEAAKPEAPMEEQATRGTFGEVVDKYAATYMVTDLKVTTRRGYRKVLDGTLLPRFKDRPIGMVNGAAASQLDLELTKADLARGTRNNAQIVLRSVLRFAKERGYLSAIPSSLPRLKQPEPSILEIPSDDQVEEILGLACPTQRLSFALMAYAGLRPNEVRALLRRDVKLRREGDEPVGGFLGIREGLSYGELHTPKTGKREIPIARPLARLLALIEKGPRDGHVAVTQAGETWGQSGLDQAFERVRDRAGLAGWSVYALRHYAITMWL